MIYYRLLKRVNNSNISICYLSSKDFKYKKPIRVFDILPLNTIIYKDIDSLFPISKLTMLNEDLFNVLSYKEVEDFFSNIQDYISSTGNAKDLLKDLERTLLYWDDYN